MPEARTSNWWMITVAIFGAVTAINSVGPALVGGSGTDDPVGDVFRIIGVVTGLAAAGLLLGGLRVLSRQVVAGTWMVIIGSLMGTLPFLLPVGVLVIASGFWTGNLRLQAAPDGSAADPLPAPRAADRRSFDLLARWYLWLVAAVALAVFGFLFPLLVFTESSDFGSEEEGFMAVVSGVAWMTWWGSWFSAAAAAAIGVVLGGVHGVSRHRTRPA